MGISVGSVTVDIVPDTTNFRRDLNARLKDLSVQVRAELEDKKFLAELDAATRDRKVDVKVDEKGSLDKANKASLSLWQTLGLLAPAAAPLTAVAVGATAALGGLGAAGLLAFKGIQNEMKAGTPAGLVYTGMVKSLKDDLTLLEKTAADGIITGFSQAVQVTDNALPQLRTEIGLLSKSLGSDLAPIASGVFALLHDLDPTLNNITGGIHALAVDFENWATGPGGVRFATYLATELPKVAHVLESLGSAGAHLVTALLPLGGPVLGAIQGISTAIAHLPVSVIQDLFFAFAAYKSVTLAQAAIDGFSGSLVKLGLVEKGLALSSGGGAAGGVAGKSGLLASLGPLGLVAGGAALLFGTLATSKSNDASDFQKQVDALAGNPAKLKQQQDLLKSLQAQRSKQLAAGPGLGSGGQTVNLGGKTFSTGATAAGSSDLGAQIQDLKKLTTAAAAAAPKVADLQAANLAMGLNAKGTADAITGEAVSLATLISNADRAAAAQQGLYGATTNVHQALSDANKALKANGETLNLNTQKGRDNRTALLNVANAQRAVLDADATTAAGRRRLNTDTSTSIAQLETLAHKMGLSTTKAHELATALLGIKSVKVNFVDAGYGPMKADLANIIALERQASGRGTPRAAGGQVFGPGTGTSDSIAARLSNGEFVVNANATAKNLALLHKINSSTPAFAAGGQVGYAAGGQVDANLSAITALLSGPVTTAANVSAARLAEARATASLASAESALQKLRDGRHTTSGQINAAEKRITADRIALANATTRLRTSEAAYIAGRQPLSSRYASSVASVTRTDGAFLANLNRLAARGFGFLAQELLAEGDSDAMTVAAQAAKWGNAQLSALQSNLQKDAAYQTQLQNFGHAYASQAVNQGQGATPIIYVQNPWTGEYLLSQSDSRTQSLLRQQARGIGAGRR